MSGLLTTDSDGKITSFNPEAMRITGLGADDVLGLELDNVMPGATEILKGFGGKTPENGARTRLSYLSSTGEKLYLGLADSVLRGEDGSDLGRVVIFQDVTDVVAMETSLTRSERLAAVGELSAKIAHEIRNPLASISGSIQILASEQEVEGESARLMGIVVRETDRLNDLITDFLRYARPAPTVTRPVNVDQLIDDLVEMLEPTLPGGIELRVDIKPGHWIECDADQMMQMLWNLCLNAIQSMSEGGELKLSVSSWERGATQEESASFRKGTTQGSVSKTAGGGSEDSDSPESSVSDVSSGPTNGVAQGRGESTWLEIEVSDTGCGISEEVLDKIFEPFFTTKQRGTGLGLSTAHRIVENHGGELQLDSQLGEGTVFRIRLPGAEVSA